MKIFSDFRKFAMRGNVIDMAIGVIIGGSFGKIVTSLVNDVIMPLLSLATSKVNISDLTFVLHRNPDGSEVLIRYGSFFQTVFDFIIIAFCIFIMIKIINSMRNKEPDQSSVPAAETKSEKLLGEIKELLSDTLKRSDK